jgi:hypothetical protein
MSSFAEAQGREHAVMTKLMGVDNVEEDLRNWYPHYGEYRAYEQLSNDRLYLRAQMRGQISGMGTGLTIDIIKGLRMTHSSSGQA